MSARLTEHAAHKMLIRWGAGRYPRRLGYPAMAAFAREIVSGYRTSDYSPYSDDDVERAMVELRQLYPDEYQRLRQYYVMRKRRMHKRQAVLKFCELFDICN